MCFYDFKLFKMFYWTTLNSAKPIKYSTRGLQSWTFPNTQALKYLFFGCFKHRWFTIGGKPFNSKLWALPKYLDCLTVRVRICQILKLAFWQFSGTGLITGSLQERCTKNIQNRFTGTWIMNYLNFQTNLMNFVVFRFLMV